MSQNQTFLGISLHFIFSALCITSDDEPSQLGVILQTTANKCLPLKAKLIKCDDSTGGATKPTKKGCTVWCCQSQGTKLEQLQHCLPSLNCVIYQTKATTVIDTLVLYGESLKHLIDDVLTYLKLVDWENEA